MVIILFFQFFERNAAHLNAFAALRQWLITPIRAPFCVENLSRPPAANIIYYPVFVCVFFIVFVIPNPDPPQAPATESPGTVLFT